MPAATNSDQRRRTWGRAYSAFSLLLLVGVLWYLGWQIYASRHVLTSLEVEWSPFDLAASFGLAVLGYQLLFGAWLLLLRRASLYEARHLRAYLRIWWVSYMYRYVPGKVFLLVERVRRGSAADIPYATGAALPVIETILSLVAGCAVSLLSVSYYASMANELLFSIAALLGFTVFVIPYAYRWITRIPAISRRYPQLASIDLDTADILILLLPYIAHYLLFGLALFLFARNVHPLPWPVLPGLCGVYALSHVLSVLVVVAPGGIGVREGVLTMQLQKLALAGVAGVLAIGARVWFSFAELACLLFVVTTCQQSPAPGGTDRLGSSA